MALEANPVKILVQHHQPECKYLQIQLMMYNNRYIPNKNT